MHTTPKRRAEQRLPRGLRSPRQRAAAATAASAVAVAAALVLVFGAVLGPGKAGTAPLLAGFEARSYRPGQVALLHIGGGTTNAVTLQLFLAGGAADPRAKARAWDGPTFGRGVTPPVQLHRPSGQSEWVARVPLGATWPSGDYVARLSWHGHTDYAPFILRPRTLGSEPVLVVEPTNTWHAYDVVDGDSWYLDPKVHVIDLTHPFAAFDVRGSR